MSLRGRPLWVGAKERGVALDEYLQEHRLGHRVEAEGSFTLDGERARTLLAERALSDPWQAWLCLVQGWVQAQAEALAIAVGPSGVRCRVSLPGRRTVAELCQHDRFLLGWLNLAWFGEPVWDPGGAELRLVWGGNPWRRYRLAKALRAMLGKALAYSPVPVDLEGRRLQPPPWPRSTRVSLYPLPQGRPGGLPKPAGALPEAQVRAFSLAPLGSPWQAPSGPGEAAYAYTSGRSWSQLVWVSHGVIISEQRNLLERPGVTVVASVEALGLQTDLSGFSVIPEDLAFRWLQLVKRDVLWML